MPTTGQMLSGRLWLCPRSQRAAKGATIGETMQLRQITYFLAVCRELNFTRAARSCGVSQPSLTGCIKRLEIEIGGDLFARKPTVQLTRLGHAMRPYLERIGHEATRAFREARSLTGSRSEVDSVDSWVEACGVADPQSPIQHRD